ncbi:MAG: cysteine-rich small domain-containing protein [Desulfovibrio sp.]|nr:cysteine-rich small domain-containing protein [Desulfovibrio sp.]
MDSRDWHGKGYSFFANTGCEHFPCHPGADPANFSCLFCYCPLYLLGERCGGGFRYLPGGVKDCSACLFPHLRENYGAVVARYGEILAALPKPEDKGEASHAER